MSAGPSWNILCSTCSHASRIQSHDIDGNMGQLKAAGSSCQATVEIGCSDASKAATTVISVGTEAEQRMCCTCLP